MMHGLIDSCKTNFRRLSSKKKKKAVHGNTISNPKPLEVYVACTPYQRQEKGEVSLKVGMQVEIVEKTETGWWFVNVEDDQGWVPSSCLQREDGLQEDTTIKFAPGEEEQYLCTEMFKGEGKDELSLERGAVVDVVEKNLEGWWLVRYNGLEGYVPATYLVQTQALKITRKIARPTGGPEIVKSLHDISDLLRDKESTKPTTEPNNNMNAEEEEYVLEFKDDFDDGDNVYSIDELSKILRADNRGSAETDEVYESIHYMKSRSLKRSARPPPRSIRKNHSKTPGLVDRPPLVHSDSFNHEYVTVAPFSDAVGDGISFNVDEPVKVLQKSDNGWWYVEINNREGWAPASYIVERKTKTASSALQSSPLSGSRDDVTNSDDDAKSSGRRISGIGGLASALKSKLQIQQNKGSKSPPAPPRKDFLDDHHSNMSSASDNFLNLSSASKAKSENDLLAIDSSENIRRPKSKMPKNTGNRPSMPPPAPPVKSAAIDNNPSAVLVNPARNRQLPAKPSTTSKPMPPVPPAKVQLPPKPASHSENGPAPSDFASALKAKLEAKEIDQAQAQGPISPRALKPAAKPKYNEWPRTSNESKEPESEDQSRCVSVSGLANALQAKFENKDSGITKPELSQKPKPFLPSKPSVDKKPESFNAVNKPKPAVSNKTQHFNKPPDIKQPSNIEAPSQKVSDLANVLKAKFEKRDHEATADTAGSDRRTSAVVPPLVKTPPKPKPPPGNRPQRPVAPPKFNKPTPEQAIESDSVNKSLDPKKYFARPLPPKPAAASEEDTKPSLPVKPKVAIKPTLEADVPGQQENYTEIEHDGNRSNVYRAVMAYNGGSEGEIALSLGQEVTLLEKADGWWYVSCHGVEGWAPAEFLEKVPGGTRPTLVADRVSIAQNVKKQNLYRACSEFVGQQEGELSVPCGAEVEVKEKEEEGWWFVKYNNQEGWVPSAYLTEM